MTEWSIYIGVSLFFALCFCRIRLAKAALFWWSSLLSAYITVCLQPAIAAAALQRLPEEFRSFLPPATLTGVFIVLLVFIYAVLRRLIPSGTGDNERPGFLAGLTAFAAVFCAVMTISGMAILGVSSLPCSDTRLDFLKRTDVRAIGEDIVRLNIRLIQLGKVTEAQNLWICQYPQTALSAGNSGENSGGAEEAQIVRQSTDAVKTENAKQKDRELRKARRKAEEARKAAERDARMQREIRKRYLYSR